MFTGDGKTRLAGRQGCGIYTGIGQIPHVVCVLSPCISHFCTVDVDTCTDICMHNVAFFFNSDVDTVKGDVTLRSLVRLRHPNGD